MRGAPRVADTPPEAYWKPGAKILFLGRARQSKAPAKRRAREPSAPPIRNSLRRRNADCSSPAPMKISSTRDGALTGHGAFSEKVWTVRFRQPLGFPVDNALSIQLPAGEYRLHELTAIEYELRTSGDFTLVLRVSEVERLRNTGNFVIDGTWP